jgi:hypothetical protein
MTSRAALLFAFTFAVMADPVSSVAYAIEGSRVARRPAAAPYNGLVVVIIVVVIELSPAGWPLR